MNTIQNLIINSVCRAHQLPRELVLGDSRHGTVVEARKQCAVLLRDFCQLELKKIAEIMGRRCHTTVLNHICTHKKLFRNDPNYARKYRLSVEYINSNTIDMRENIFQVLKYCYDAGKEGRNWEEILTVISSINQELKQD